MRRDSSSISGLEAGRPLQTGARSHQPGVSRCAFLTLLLLAWSVPATAPAALTVLTVDSAAQRGSPADLPDNCTLGDAIVAATRDAAEDGCAHPNLGSGGPFEIVLPAGSGPYVLRAAEGAGTDGDNGLPPVAGVLVLRGNGNSIERNAALACPDPAGADFRLLEVSSAGELEVEDAVLRNGCAPSGGAILNGGFLTLRDVVVTGNTAFSGAGGGVQNLSGVLQLVGSSVSGNRARGSGGGIDSRGDATLTVLESTVAENAAGIAGGIHNLIGRTTLVNSTLSSNSAATSGGLENSGGGLATLISSTVFGNTVTVEGDGIVNRNGSLRFANSILQNRCLFLRSPGSPDGGYNIERSSTCGLTAATSLVNTPPRLGPLQDNGGRTRTHAPRVDSPARDGGDDALCSGPDVGGIDQRGVERPDGDPLGGGRCDVGAVEFVDCDGNGVDDGTEIGTDASLDADGNGVLDACEDQTPQAVAGPDRDVECNAPDGADVTLDGTGSSDPGGDPLSFEWLGSFGSATGPTPTVPLPLGAEVVTLTVRDPEGNADSDSLRVTVADTTPPVVEAALVRTSTPGWRLRGLQRFEVHFSCTDVCDPAPVVTATLDGAPVEDGEVFRQMTYGRKAAGAPVLSVTCRDASGNLVTTEAEAGGVPALHSPEAAPGPPQFVRDLLAWIAAWREGPRSGGR